jgi:sulfur carrier protein
MNITINGQVREFREGLTVAALLEAFDLATERVAVEWNGEIVSREDFANHVLRDGDVIEIVRFVGGG